MNILKSITYYLWNVIKSAGALLWTIPTRLVRRAFILLIHIFLGPYHFVLGMGEGIKLLLNDPKTWVGWLGKSMLQSLAWIGRLISKTLDILMLGEILDLAFQVVKPNQRTLTSVEIEESRKVFGDALNYWQIRIDEASLFAWIGAKYARKSNMGVTTFHAVNFTRKIETAPGNNDMIWLIHELAHVSQMEHVGIQYIVEALVAQNTGGYHFGGVAGLADKELRDFNREQQAEIAAHYYDDVLYGHTPSHYYMPLILELRDPNGLW